MSANACWPAVMLCVVVACADNGNEEVHGGGTIIPWNSRLVIVDADTIVAASVGLSSVELLDIGGSTVGSTAIEPDAEQAIPSTCADRAPMSLALVTPTRTGRATLVVQDPCGVWIAERNATGDFAPLRSAELEEIGPSLYVEVFPDGRRLALGNDPYVAIVALMDVREPADLQLAGGQLHHRVSHMMRFQPAVNGEGPSTLLAQRHAAIEVIRISEDNSIQTDAVLLQEVSPPYTKPFDAFEHFTVLPGQGCPSIAVGIGLFDRSAGNVPRRLQMLELDIENAETRSRDLTGTDGVRGIVALQAPDGLQYSHFLSVLGESEAGHYFSVYGLEACSDWALLATSDVEFSIQTPPTPGWGEVKRVPESVFVSLVGQISDGRELEIYHYDGYDLRILTAGIDDWSIRERTVALHASRTDLSIR